MFVFGVGLYEEGTKAGGKRSKSIRKGCKDGREII
jgi:hypothetical protein